MQEGATGPIHFLNLEYFFRLIYGAQGQFTSGDVPFLEAFLAWVAHAWGILGIASFLFVIAAFLVLAYATMRLYQIREREDRERYSTLAPAEEEKRKDHSRWAHIQQLAASPHESDWRQAVIEADIMLEEVLRQAGYEGATIGDRLKTARFDSLDDAWEAHKVRNEIAHQGSAFRLDDNVAYRTIKKYERVFKEFGEI